GWHHLSVHVVIMYFAVVLYLHTLGYSALVPLHDAPADEEVDVAIPVVIGRHHPRSAAVLGRQAADRLVEVAPPPSVVQVQPVLQRGRHRRKLAAAAHHVKVWASVAVGIGKHGAQDYRGANLRETRLVSAQAR